MKNVPQPKDALQWFAFDRTRECGCYRLGVIVVHDGGMTITYIFEGDACGEHLYEDWDILSPQSNERPLQ